jgi:hypothetical protein
MGAGPMMLRPRYQPINCGRCDARRDYFELGKLPRLGVNLNRPGTLLDENVVADGEPKAGSLTGRLGGEEGIKHLFPYLWRNAGAAVANPNLHFVTEVFVVAVRIGSYVSLLLCPLRYLLRVHIDLTGRRIKRPPPHHKFRVVGGRRLLKYLFDGFV